MINIIPHDVENTQRTERLLKALGTVGSVTVLRPMPANRVFVVGPWPRPIQPLGQWTEGWGNRVIAGGPGMVEVRSLGTSLPAGA